MRNNRRTWILLYQLAAGLCDTSTGALLIAAPQWTFRLMGLHIVPDPVAFVRFIGVFVMGVGLSYLWPLLRLPMREWRGQWSTTAIIRSGVALLLAWQVATGGLERGWLTVAATDAFLASVQWAGLSRNWLNFAD
jgi:hypothetical protein